MSIQRFSLHDGPGIRTTVFLQGCPLHCPWCSNPESQPVHPVQRHARDKCVRCLRCVAACPSSLISPGPDGYPVFDRDSCQGCLSCEKSCPAGAISISGKQLSIREIMETVERDSDYYRNSGGGVTFSGGEPFMQGEALISLLEESAGKGIHTAIETCGQVPSDIIRRAYALTDLFLFDLKHCDGRKLKSITGADIDLILGNLAMLAGSGNVTVRIPCIPGFNLDSESLSGMFGIAVSMGIREVHLLPYHILGMDKYEQLQRQYSLPGEGLAKEVLEPYAAIGRSMGLNVGIGG
ncbi:MAG: glycyl-radical enzyme activating protein [Bacteroidales bacterium]|nr:glycyl-radical enzyme activating protein [Bacteroidales bacterium]